MANINPFLIPDSQNPKDRSFIDLSYDGVAMSELGLIVVYQGTQSDYLTPQFTNNNSTIPGREGLIVWNTEIANGIVTRQLATDCMTSRQLNRLKQILKPGKICKLILAERPYCYAWAMLESVPQLNFVPTDKTISVNRVLYTDVIYRGDVTISWILVDSHWYGEPISTIQPYKKQSWIFESGLPLTLQNDVIYANQNYTRSSSSKMLKVANCGNTEAKCALKMHFSAGSLIVNSSNVTNWQIIDIKKNGETITQLYKPRIFQDTEYVYNLLSTVSGLSESTFETYKTEILNNLRSNLDSNLEWRNQLLHMVQATFNSNSGGGKYTLTSLKTAIKKIFNSADFTIIIDGVNRQMTLTMKATVINWTDPEATQTKEMISVQNLEGVSNGKYITIDGNSSLANDFSVVPVTLNIVSSSTPQATYISFINEYE